MPFSDYDEFMFIFNGHFSNSVPSIPYNRGMKFGETVFTSFLLRNGKVIGLESHKNRLKKSLKLLYPELEIPSNTFEFLKKLPQIGVYKVRVNFFADLYKNLVLSLVELAELENHFFNKNENLKVITKIHHLETNLNLSKLKYTNYALTNLMSENNNDVLKMNEKKEVFELSTSNILFLKNEKFILPKGNYLKGIGLDYFIEFVGSDHVHERRVQYSEIKEMNGALSLNAVRFLREILSIDNIDMKNNNLFSLREKFKDFLIKKEKNIC